MSQTSTAPTTKAASPLGVRNFRLLWIGESVSLLGDQFTLIAYPWLVLQLTGDALILGTVMALMGIPRALFMLIGGALVDRFSPRTIMLVTNAARLVLVGVLAALTLSDAIQLWMLYGFALLFGLADAFYFPGQSSIVPQILDKDQLQSGNTIVQGTAQLSLFLGPVLAGGLIALVGGTASASADALPSMIGIGVAFGIDALSFLASVGALWLMRPRRAVELDADQRSVIQSIAVGMRYLWQNEALRFILILIVASNFFIMGPMMIGIPVLAKTTLAEGAAAYGIVMSAFGGGALVGIILSGVLPRLKPARMGTILLTIQALMGVALALLPLSTATAYAAVMALLMGAVNGYVNISFFTWLQKRVPEYLMGRVMSVIMFASVGLTPVSTALAGVLIDWNLTAVFIGGGILMALVTLLSLTSRAVRDMGMQVTGEFQAVSVGDAVRATSELPNLRTATGEIPIIGGD
ncbi:MAG: MFS transporter [Chloroflexi bacterium]|nr:MFS transporter [Chloroflexota bacterium]